MREYATPQTVEIRAHGNLTDDVVRNATETPAAVLFSRPGDAEEPWRDVSATQFHTEVVATAKGLIAAGVAPGDRVGLISRTRYEWTLFDYAIWFAGAISVPIYETSSTEQMAWILADSGAVGVVVEDANHAERVTSVRDELPALQHLWWIDEGAVATLAQTGAEITDAELERRRTAAGPDDVATLIYTSGTTGRPKGCMLTHGNFEAELSVAIHELRQLFQGEGAATLLFLPLAHVFARIIQVGCVKAGARLGHSADINHLVTNLQTFRPTFLLAVPRVFEKVFNTASQNATIDGRGKLFDRAADVAIAWSRGQDTGRIPVRVRAQHAAFSKVVYARLRDTLGGRCEFAISGGAPLGERLAHFYRGIGVTVLEGYGLTETTAALTVNLPDAQKVGTVGRPLPGTAVRVTDDGELAFSGGQVFGGYWDNDDATAAALVDGWFHTGDVGEVDDEGFVRITGRKKEILVTAGGKNVAPGVLEDRVRAHGLVSQCLVVGDGQPFIAALITVDAETVATWAEHRGKPSTAAPDLVDDPDLLAEIQRAVDDANQAVSKAEAIRRFVVLDHDWSEEAGQLTPSLKLKRNIVIRHCADEIASLYER